MLMKNVHWQKLLFLSILAFLASSCEKDFTDSPSSAKTVSSTALRSNGALDTLVRKSPSFPQLQVTMQSIQEHWPYPVYRDIVDEYGYLHWNQAHLEMEATEDVADYLFSIPSIKNGLVTGMLFSLYEDGTYLYDFVSADVMDQSAQALIATYGYNEALLLAASFSHHQYFHNGQVGEYQAKLLEINNTATALPRCVRADTHCHWICFGEECVDGYLDCYWVTVAVDCFRGGSLVRQGNPPIPPRGGTGSVDPPSSSDQPNIGNISWEPQEDCHVKLSPHLEREINRLDIAFPCDSRSPNDVVVGIMERLCQDALADDQALIIDMSMLEQELARYDQIDTRALCPRAKCVLNEILDLPPNEANCNILHSFNASGNMHLVFRTDDFSKRDDKPYGEITSHRTHNPAQTRVFDIAINEELCSPEVDLLRVAETLFHESIHAELLSIAMEAGWNGDPNDGPAFLEIWNLVAEKKYGGRTDQHEIMLQDYLDQVASSLRALNGGQHELEDYYYLVLEGIPPEILAQNGIFNLDPYQYKYDLNVLGGGTTPVDLPFNCYE